MSAIRALAIIGLSVTLVTSAAGCGANGSGNPGDGVNPPVTIDGGGPFSGNGKIPSEDNHVVLSPAFLGGGAWFAFGSVVVGSSTARSQMIESTTNATITVTLSVSGSGTTDFAVSPGTCGSTETFQLAPNGRCMYSVTFAPSAAGSRTATLTVSVTNGSSTSQDLSGTGTTPGGSSNFYSGPSSQP
jgi:Abnormal spindle-like microcephaly-assoc'd, ASPM-SPD-2-Hydin